MSSSREGVPPPPAPIQLGSPKPPPRFTRTPSTYTTGSFAWVRLAVARIRICAPSPVSPPLGSTETEGSRAASCSDRLVTGALRSVEASMVVTVLPSLRFSVSAPAPVTTIAAPQMRAEAILRSGDVISTSLGMGTACPIAAGTKVALTACPWCDDTQPQQVLRLQHGWPGGPDAPMYWRLPSPSS